MTTTINASNSGSGGLVQTADASGILALQTAGTTAVTIDTSQNATFVGYVNAPNTFGFKNRIINGQLNINQRGVSGTVTLTAGSYGHDRFKGGASGCTYTFATSNNVTTLTISAGSLIQVVEGLNLESGTYTLSFTGTAQGKIGAGSFSASGVTGSITGGTDTNIEFNTGTLSLPQLEKGSIATSFDYRSYGTELALCQRYAQVLGRTSGACMMVGQCYSTSAAYTGYQFLTTMRSAPTLSYSALSDWAVNTSGAAPSVLTAWTAINATTQNIEMLFTGTGISLVPGDATVLQAQNANATFTLSAEL
jgi:hypothetical protein